jgi:serine/threonine-protein kinase
MTDVLRGRLERYVERHVATGETLDVAELCSDRPDLEAPLRGLVQRYHALATRLAPGTAASPAAPGVLPAFDGYRTIERLGSGGAGEVFKVWDTTLERHAAAKVLTPGARRVPDFADVVREARALAGCSDPRIVQVYAIRADASPPVLFMEYVDGFELGRVARSLEVPTRSTAPTAPASRTAT